MRALMSECPVLCTDCLSARSHNGRGQLLRAFHVEHDGAARHAGQHILCKQHHLPVGVDHIAVLGDDAQATAVAVEGQPQFRIGLAQDAPDVFEVSSLLGSGWWLESCHRRR